VCGEEGWSEVQWTYVMASFLTNAVHRELRSMKGGTGRGPLAEGEIAVAVILCFGVLAACIFLLAKGICGKLGRSFLGLCTELKYMLMASCRPRESPGQQQLASVPVSRPDMQPPPVRFTPRQAKIPSRNHRNTDNQPPLPKVCISSNESSSKVSRQGVATEDVPHLLGRERSLAIPWSLLESDTKCKRYRKKSGDSLPNSNNVGTSTNQLATVSAASAKNPPSVSKEDLPRLLGRTSAHPKPGPKQSWKKLDRDVECSVAPAAATSGSQHPSALPTLRTSEFVKNDQRHRKQPCYGSSCYKGASTSATSVSQLAKKAPLAPRSFSS
jgi:hypothetical protein